MIKYNSLPRLTLLVGYLMILVSIKEAQPASELLA
jgi:hypothetical protein